jgi:hypothetical protein
MIGLHDHHRGHSTRVARTVEKTFASSSPGHYCGTNAASIEIVQLFPPSVSRVMGRAAPHKRHLVHDAQCELPALRRSARGLGAETYIDDAIRNVSEIARRV